MMMKQFCDLKGVVMPEVTDSKSRVDVLKQLTTGNLANFESAEKCYGAITKAETDLKFDQVNIKHTKSMNLQDGNSKFVIKTGAGGNSD